MEHLRGDLALLDLQAGEPLGAALGVAPGVGDQLDDPLVLLADAVDELLALDQVGEALAVENDRDQVGLVGLVELDEPPREQPRGFSRGGSSKLYQSDQPDLISVILNSKGFADLIEREEFIHRIGEQDKRIIELVAQERPAQRQEQLRAARRPGGQAAQDHRAGAPPARRGRAGARAARRQARLLRERPSGAGGPARLDPPADAASWRRGELGTDLRAEEQETPNALAVANGAPSLPAGPIHGGGQLIWPVNGPITSPFCERRAWESCHPRIDIGVPAGTPIRAAASGTRAALMQSEAASGGYPQIPYS